jgi:hypothetical protein
MQIDENTRNGAPSKLARRSLMSRAGLGATALGIMAVTGQSAAHAADATNLDPAILNFALNLEYLEAEYYLRGVNGTGLPSSLTGGTGRAGSVSGGRLVTFSTQRAMQAAQEIAQDEYNHVVFLRSVLGDAVIAEPAIDLVSSFRLLGEAVGLGSDFDPFANETNFLIGAFLFEDVGVTAYSGAAPLVTSKDVLAAAAGILAVEAYHAAEIRGLLLQAGQSEVANKISAARAALSGTGPGFGTPADDQGITLNGVVNLVPASTSSIAFARTPQQVLSMVYLGGTTSGGFFPNGANGTFVATT